MLKVATGAPISHVPYRGSTPAITDLIAGQVQMYFDNVPNLLQFVQAGNLKAIALTSEKRDPKYPDLPTMAEGGLTDFVIAYWNGVLAPAGTPAGVVTKLSGVINEGLRSAEMQASLRKLGAEPQIASVQEFGGFLLAENQKWARVAKAADIKVE
jgi:tripartite-type tricarboxylate transporter receptor subunit TctC